LAKVRLAHQALVVLALAVLVWGWEIIQTP